jgi:hypothetical protein
MLKTLTDLKDLNHSTANGNHSKKHKISIDQQFSNVTNIISECDH